jgi:hypothetical protein
VRTSHALVGKNDRVSGCVTFSSTEFSCFCMMNCLLM